MPRDRNGKGDATPACPRPASSRLYCNHDGAVATIAVVPGSGEGNGAIGRRKIGLDKNRCLIYYPEPTFF